MYLNADIFSFLQLQRLLKNIMSHQAHYRNKERNSHNSTT